MYYLKRLALILCAGTCALALAGCGNANYEERRSTATDRTVARELRALRPYLRRITTELQDVDRGIRDLNKAVGSPSLFGETALIELREICEATKKTASALGEFSTVTDC